MAACLDDFNRGVRLWRYKKRNRRLGLNEWSGRTLKRCIKRIQRPSYVPLVRDCSATSGVLFDRNRYPVGMYMNNWRIIVSGDFVRISLRLMYVYVLVWRHEKGQHKPKQRGICSETTHRSALCPTRHHSSTKCVHYHGIDDDARTQSRATPPVWYCHENVTQVAENSGKRGDNRGKRRRK